jgi:serine/threonine-protein kinase RsbW
MAISPDQSDGCAEAPVRAPPPALSTGMPDWTADQAPDVRAPLTITAPADGSTASWARHEFNAWLAIDVPAGELFDDLVLAVYEALANAVDHAYLDTDTGPVQLLARRSRTALHVTVTDRGTWRTPASPTTAAPTIRGRGLPLIRGWSTMCTSNWAHAAPPSTCAPPFRHRPKAQGGRQSSRQLPREGSSQAPDCPQGAPY